MRHYVRPEGVSVVEEVLLKVEYFGPEHIKNAPGRFYAKGSRLSNMSYQGAYFGASDVPTALPVGATVTYVHGGGVSPPHPGLNSPNYLTPGVPSTPEFVCGAADGE